MACFESHFYCIIGYYLFLQPSSELKVEGNIAIHNHTSSSLIAMTDTQEKLVYVGMSADIVHLGHANIIQTANKLISDKKADRLIIGLLTCEAVASYKRKPIVPWNERKELLLAFKGVDTVVAQDTLDYEPNLGQFKPAYCVHGSD